MVDFPIRRGTNSADVAILQDMLNRMGALLDDDGRFGGATEIAVRHAQGRLGLPPTGEVSAETWARLETVPEPSPLLPTRGVTFIAREEIGTRERYDSVFCAPCWPGGESGITIGIGYDLRFDSDADFARNWSAHLAPSTFAALKPWLRKIGTSAGAASLRDHKIPFEAAWDVYLRQTIPECTTKSGNAFSGYDRLPPLCKSALASLVYNRGAAMDGDRRVEMRAIRDLIAAGRLDAVAAQFEAMKRLWPDVRGLRDRRDREARLWRDGLNQA